jgi:hypothetical protein
MSTKTLRKRIALVAVATLGTGVLSVAPANAAVGAVTIAVSANGVASSATQGLVTAAGAAISASSSTTATATMLSNGQLVVTTTNAGDQGHALVVSGGVFSTCTTAATLSTDRTTATNTSSTAIVCIAKPNAVGTNMVIVAKDDDAITGVTGAALTVSVVAASTIGVFSSVYSNIKVQEAADADGTLAGTANSDDKYTSGGFHDADYGAVTTTTRKNGVQGFLNFVLEDGNDNALATTNALTATATGGCLVGLSTTTQIGTSKSALYNGTGGYVSVGQAVANAPYKCVVTLAVNGSVIATRTFVLQGQVTKLVVSDQVIAHTGVDTTAAFYVDAQDASGNSVPDVTIGSVTSTYNASVTGVSVPAVSEVTAGTPGTVTCDVKGSNTGLKLYAQNASVALVYSDAFSVSCAGSPVNYAASLDKASYTIGEVATLTITAKDSAGNLTWDGAELGDSTSATTASTYAVSIAGGPMTQVGTIVSTDSFVSGVKKYKFTVGGISSGSFQLVVDLPVYNSTTYSQTAAAVAYKVTTGADGGVQLADVLKAIVSLIASINKQIAALQKALLKK